MLRILTILTFACTSGWAIATELTEDEVYQLEDELWEYDPGPIDGVWDDLSARALEAYQADWGLPENGQLTSELIDRLQRRHPATRPGWAPVANGCTIWNGYPAAKEKISWSGGCEYGRAEGKGILTWEYTLRGERRTDTYAGDLKDGREHGQGRLTTAVGYSYVGGFKEGLKHGYGIERFANGNSYEGGFSEDLKHGQGIRIWAEGERYEGEHRESRPHGRGKFTDSAGQVFEGIWKNGCFEDGDRWAHVSTSKEACGFK